MKMLCRNCNFVRFLYCSRASFTKRNFHYDVGNQNPEVDGDTDSKNPDEYSSYDVPYKGHIHTSLFQKLVLAAGSSAVSLAAPWRGDMVATCGETTGIPALRYMLGQMEAHPTGQQILREKPRINSQTVDLDYLAQLPEGTFGRTYSDFLAMNRIHPDDRPPVQFVDDPALAYVMIRYRETHDLLHALLGMPTHLLGEIAVKWVEALHTGLPMCVFGAVLAPVRLGPKHFQKYLDSHLWWAIRNGRNGENLLNVYYEKHWEEPLDELRAKLNLEPPPPTPQLRKRRDMEGE